jgi:hypothetical protein
MTNRNQSKGLALAAGLLLLALVFTLVWRTVSAEHFWTGQGGQSAKLASERSKTAERNIPDEHEKRRRSLAISKAAQKWYEEVLEKYPDLAPKFRDVPDEQNGYLQFLQMADSLKESRLPDHLTAMLNGNSEWNAAVLRQWLDENRAYVDQVLKVAELPDQSTKGIDYLRFPGTARLAVSEFVGLLSGCARLAFESGDTDAALRYCRAGMNMGSHFIDIEVPTMLHEAAATIIRGRMNRVFYEHVLPGLSDEEIRAWRDALAVGEAPSSEYGRALIGEWNYNLRSFVLPALLGGSSPTEGKFQMPDIDAFIDVYAMMTRKSASGLGDASPGRLDLTMNGLSFAESELSSEAIDGLQSASSGLRSFFEALGAESTRKAMSDAAIAIKLGEEPPVDPVSGLPFVWDSENRVLSAPPGREGMESVKVP